MLKHTLDSREQSLGYGGATTPDGFVELHFHDVVGVGPGGAPVPGSMLVVVLPRADWDGLVRKVDGAPTILRAANLPPGPPPSTNGKGR